MTLNEKLQEIKDYGKLLETMRDSFLNSDGSIDKIIAENRANFQKVLNKILGVKAAN